MLDLQHQYNNCTTIPHMRMGPIYWGSPSCEELLYSCCIGVVQESNPIYIYIVSVFVSCYDHARCGFFIHRRSSLSLTVKEGYVGLNFHFSYSMSLQFRLLSMLTHSFPLRLLFVVSPSAFS
jgi:hypothetical protein